jgi:Domain of unknown function (DUF4179)/Family of unknown function (DUF5643)
MSQDFKDWLDLDIDEIKPKPLSAEQKAKIKYHVLTKGKKKKRINVRYLAGAALLGISVITASFISLPAIANQLPFVQSILTNFEEDALPKKYEDFATVVNQVQSSNGLDVMIENAVYDGTNIILTYAIQTNEELGNHPRAEGFINVEPSNGSGGTGSIEKMNGTTYVGIEKVTPHFTGESPEEVFVQWEPTAFGDFQMNTEIKGDWEFEFTLTQLPTNVQLLDQTISQDGLTLVMISLEHSEMSDVLRYNFYVEESVLKDWPFVSIEMSEAKDNLGNVYKLNGNGGISHNEGASNEWGTTIYSIDPNATSLTFTPQIYYSKGSGELVETEYMKPVTIQLD